MKKNRIHGQKGIFILILFMFAFCSLTEGAGENSWVVVDTGQTKCYSAIGGEISSPAPGAAFYGQDAQYAGNQPHYIDNGDGTITDLNTGLMWQQDHGEKMTYTQAAANAASFNLAGYTDWRLPTIKELYSLILFSGIDPSDMFASDTSGLVPFIDTRFFNFEYGDVNIGERIIDAQYTSATRYVDTTMNGNETVFGVNFADGRIKGYGISTGGSGKTFFVKYVRGTTGYGQNNFVDNGDNTVTDQASGLMWTKNDSGKGMNWQEALAWVQQKNSENYLGYNDWRLPNAKELQSIVDYTRSPATTDSAAIDPVFNVTTITDEGGGNDYPFYWTGTTHANQINGSSAVYIAFGRALGWMSDFWGNYQLMDVHGAGAQRCDPKAGNPNDYPYGRGPQGDVVRIYNYVRCVRDAGNFNTGTTYTLTIESFPDSGAAITVSPADNNGSRNGSTTFTRTYDAGTEVTLTAPASYNGKIFSSWSAGNTSYTSRTVYLTMDSHQTAAVTYVSQDQGSAKIVLDRERLNFGLICGGAVSPERPFFISSVEGTLNWTVSSNVPWLNLSPVSGTGHGRVTVSAIDTGLAVGTYTGTISVSADNASNSPQTITVYLRVKNAGSAPFGNYDTPAEGSVVSSSVPFSGWVLDDLGISSVKLYREEGSVLKYIGAASLVEGARPDVEAYYPDYPDCSQAGWGYMMLTNFLPNGGNGTFTIHAVATDIEGRQTNLGSRAITVDNANAVKPFGAIDTPGQGGTASGSAYICWGWALTPQPGSIPTDGSTINVLVDGVNIGHPVYNIYRSDIASLFPGYANSKGAIGYFYLDTTAYSDGVHTIQWTVRDSSNNSDGIGSRYFSINNGGASDQTLKTNSIKTFADIAYIPLQYTRSITAKTGIHENRGIAKIQPGSNGVYAVNLNQTGRLELALAGAGSHLQGYLAVGDRLKPLPIGSTLDSENGIFYWLPGPGFYGDYNFVFIHTGVHGNPQRTLLTVRIGR